MHSLSNILSPTIPSWSSSPKGEGILVAADETVEWLLPWWWSRISAFSSHPICFVDLGLSYFGRRFCEEKGLICSLSHLHLPSFFPHEKRWEQLFGKNIEKRRENWFKKPFAFLLTPFQKTLWLDIDCEVIKTLDFLFEKEGEIYLAPESDLTQEREFKLKTISEGEILYNSGVVLYQHGCLLIQHWAQAIWEEGEAFISDQHTLSHLIQKLQYPIQILDLEYNWRMAWGLNLQAVIIHWVGTWGKEFIRRYCGIGEELAAIPPL